MHLAIETQNLCKSFSAFTAVRNVNLQVKTGSVYGYLGANGAGKTTTIRLLIDLLRADSGKIQLLGKNIRQHFRSIASGIGICPGEIQLWDELTGRQTLDYLQNFFPDRSSMQDRLTSDFKLTPEILSKKVGQYSMGMKQKILLVQAMQHDPDILILDEPSERLDPLMQNVLYTYIREFQSRGKTVFFSSHNLAEVEKICDYIGIIKDGELLVQEHVQTLKSKIEHTIKIWFNTPVDSTDFSINGCKIVETREYYLKLNFTGPIALILEKIKSSSVKDIIIPEPTLEEFFMDHYMPGENHGR